ncbi:MAG: uridine kinase [Bacilli bacterium]|jgi:uridine kinase|nr:uridine kinase [Bacilli bacterium]MDD2681857.1 uridine kinase [Bacilli bacterium]MDD3121314.1 uridine kinase [Bacilli bacterium]MDD4063435.1 uridine kinase [Bacilli bacterium]MDD4482096.1 uridine kinase [Bacilli bacterium]
MNCTIIGISGGTASGKTTVALNIKRESETYGSVAVIRLDDYYKKQDEIPLEERKKVNYDHPSAYDSNLLIKHLKDLKAGKEIQKPIYDFVNHTRAKESVIIKPSNIIIVEGIMIFAISKLLKMFDIKLFVDTPDDIRFIRRLLRDTNQRGRSVDSVINQYLTTVRPMHEQFVEPSKVFADVIIPEGGENLIAIDIIVSKILNILKK